jgi:hypothetical protein
LTLRSGSKAATLMQIKLQQITVDYNIHQSQSDSVFFLYECVDVWLLFWAGTHHIMKFANAQFNNKGCNESELVFHNSNVTNYQQCAGACADNSSCFSYFYHPDKQECLGCQSEYSVLRTSPVLEEWAGSMYYGRFRKFEKYLCFESATSMIVYS